MMHLQQNHTEKNNDNSSSKHQTLYIKQNHRIELNWNLSKQNNIFLDVCSTFFLQMIRVNHDYEARDIKCTGLIKQSPGQKISPAVQVLIFVLLISIILMMKKKMSKCNFEPTKRQFNWCVLTLGVVLAWMNWWDWSW